MARNLPWRTILAVLVAILFAAGAWQANRNVCPHGRVSDVSLPLPDKRPAHARLYLPAKGRRPLPAVLVCHGYLANLGFMEIPWAADLTRLGMAALFLDRRGHGLSGGTLWPPQTISRRLDDLDPDLAAALAYLRRRPEINPRRIALLGHSDGGTAVLVEGSADWDVRATVVLSASVAPFQFVNHVAPQNLLLLYGADDRFVVDYADSLLIRRATRGYLAGPGELGEIADGSARALVRVPGRGHVDLLYSTSARRAALEWLRRSLAPAGIVPVAAEHDRPIILSSLRWRWVFAGVAGMLLAVAAFAGAWERTRGSGVAHAERRGIDWAAAVVAAWALAMACAAHLSCRLQFVPAEEGPVLAAVVLAPAFGLLAAMALLRVVRYASRQRAERVTAPGHERRYDLLAGAVLSVALFYGTKLLLLHHYEVSLHGQRLVLLLLFAAMTLPLFALLDAAIRPLQPALLATGVVLVIAAVTAVLSTLLFARMAVLPGYLLTSVVGVVALHRLVNGRSSLTTAVMAGCTMAWLGAVTCALY